MKDWIDLQVAIRREAHFGDRVVNCFADRPSCYFDMISKAASDNPDGEALIFNEIRLTWRQLVRKSIGFAKGLLSRGIKPKDRLVLFLGNRTEFIIAFLACARIGVIIVPINIREQKDALRHLIQHSGASAILHERSLVELLPTKAEAPDVSFRVCPEACEGSITFSDLYEDGEISPEPVISEEDTLAINYTSGTTGPPKGVALSHMGVIHAAMFYALCVGLTSSDRSVISIPLSFTGGLVSALSVIMYCGGTVILLPEFKAARFLEIAARERMTETLMVPAMYELCIRQPDIGKYDLSSWKYGVFGAAPMRGSTVVRLAEIFPNLKLMNSYGATESGGPSTFVRPEDTAANLDAVGQAFPCVELAVMDENFVELPPGSVGELWIRSPACSSGFWRDPERTKAEYFGGFWRTGDIAVIKEDGLVRLVDRKKDMINRGGYKISSTQVEEVLHNHPSVVECAVVGRPDDVLGERVQAFIWTEDPKLDGSVLRTLCVERLPDYKIPEFFSFTDAPLPRNANGKILKRVLRESLSA
jgi:long-chain acyl-CoA synthetase